MVEAPAIPAGSPTRERFGYQAPILPSLSNEAEDFASINSEAGLLSALRPLVCRGKLADLTRPEAALLQESPPSTGESDRHYLATRIREGHDPLGDTLLRLRSTRQRRSLGATYTPREIIDPMISWIKNRGNPVRVIDPGAGSARFLLSAGRAFPEAHLVAVEIDPLAALIARSNLTAAGLDSRSTVIVDDYRRLDSGRVEGPTAYIGNPPYVRHHQIDGDWKQWLVNTAAEFGLPASKLAGLHLHFFLATLAHAESGDLGVFVTSSEWLDVNYGTLLRQMLVGLSVHMIDPRIAPFKDTATTAALTCFEIGSRAPSIRMRRVDSLEDLGDLNKGRKVGKEHLANLSKWSTALRPTRKIPAGYVELGELCRVHRGAVTGRNATWITRVGNPELPEQVLFPAVTRARELFAAGESLVDLGGLRAVVDIPTDLDALDPDDRLLVVRFLEQAREDGADTGYIARHRKRWWSVGLRQPAPILASYMARRPPTFVRNPIGVRHINIAHGLYPRQAMAPLVLDRLAEVLRDTVSLSQGRTYAGGLTKFEPREMERIPVPDLPTLRCMAE